MMPANRHPPPDAPRSDAARGPDAGLLAQITADLAGGAAAVELLQRMVAPVVALSGAEAGAIRVLSADRRRFELVAASGLPADASGFERDVHSGCGVCGQAAAALEVRWSNDVCACARGSQGLFFGPAGCRRVLAVPLLHRSQVLGVCNLFFANAAQPSPEVAALLKTMGELLGLALHNEHLERVNLRAAVVAERQQMAAEVHDSIAQTLAYAKMRMPLLEAAIFDGDPVAANRYCTDVRRAVGDAHGSLRHLLRDLHVGADTGGLRHALEHGKAALHERAAVELAVDDRVPGLSLSPPQEHQVQRIVQEALANIARHAGARHAWLTIERSGTDLEIVVDDDGSGLPERPAGTGDEEPHFGMDIMRRRAAILGGAIEFARRRGGGTRVRLRFPEVAPAAGADRCAAPAAAPARAGAAAATGPGAAVRSAQAGR